MTLSKSFIIGCRGFLGRAFYRAEKKRHPTAFGTQHLDKAAPFYLNLNDVDLSSLPIDGAGYTHAIIAAANGLINKCEAFPRETFASNVNGVLNLTSLLAKRNITPVLFSSSYVFDGKLGNYKEDSRHCPINEYGKQNAFLEKAIDGACQGNYLLIRLNKLFSLDWAESSFFDEIGEKLIRDEPIRAAYDQFLAPLSTEDVIRTVYYLQEKRATGLFNLCGKEIDSRFELAIKIADLLGKPASLIKKISIDDIGDAILRPKRTDLCLEKIFSIGATAPTSLEKSIKELVKKWQHISPLATTGLLI